MSYASIYQLTSDPTFAGRATASATEQAETYKDDGRADIAATADDVLRGVGPVVGTFVRMDAAGPGIGDKADNGDGTIDQAKVTDGDLLSLTQANFPVVAALYYTSEGVPISES
jgi:hypothetical protein